ncbi:putative E3 ubiquitin protein ligase [Golovinomyces cichoracearum]|uniref:HECT-type E3 ubiquitin transferase n=1 Tax=Golovinomyces cichoracearum TaxID=62708 RepID=A0A420IE99_9PEZI|nr:putative E3 ubiquitin protein ligase [Golovinomyces cichoracearum]
MFPNFTGSSRRPRQVNLSGQNINPFAAATSTQRTVAHAHHERLQRQHERIRINAAKKIQKTWRGHKTRQMLSDARRKQWDQLEVYGNNGNSDISILAQLRLLLSFCNSRRKDDVERIVRMSCKVVESGSEVVITFDGSRSLLLRIAAILLKALETSLPEFHPELLRYLIKIIEYKPSTLSVISRRYYSFLSLILSEKSFLLDRNILLTALKTPLVMYPDLDDSYDLKLDVYASFGMQFLSTPDLEKFFGNMEEISSIVDMKLLSSALIAEFSAKRSDSSDSERNLWLLAHFILLSRRNKNLKSLEYFQAILLQISALSGENLERIDYQDSSTIQETADVDDSSKNTTPLPELILEQFLYLTSRDCIFDLLDKLNNCPTKTSTDKQMESSLFACYALTLLRIFPRREDEIRMWLYLGSINTLPSVSIPVLNFFWQIVRKTNIFRSISTDPGAALTTLRRAMRKENNISSMAHVEDGEWHTILLFLELYAFALRFTDDEEFLSGNSCNNQLECKTVSRLRQSALPLEDVKKLSIFLKNLAFSMYYNANELLKDISILNDSNARTHLRMSSTTKIPEIVKSDTLSIKTTEISFAGITGNTFKHVKALATAVMRMLYERDSRRKFLPKDHWLMEFQLDTDGYIPIFGFPGDRRQEFSSDDEDEIDTFEGGGRLGRVLEGHETPFPGIVIQRLIPSDNARGVRSKLAEQKILASIEPRIEVLKNMPFVMHFETRVQIFRQFVNYDRRLRQDEQHVLEMRRISDRRQFRNQQTRDNLPRDELGRFRAEIRRENMFEDAYSELYRIGSGLKDQVQISFVDQFGTVEAGIDGGGVSKEFLTCVTYEALSGKSSHKFFIPNDQNLLYPNPVILDEEKENLRLEGHLDTSPYWKEKIKEILQRYEFLGRIIGKCLYEGILVDIGLAGFFLLKWSASGMTGSDYRANINDLRDLDEILYQGILQLKNYDGNVEDFSLDFTITDTISLKNGQTKAITRELMHNGSSITVNNENRPLYISYVARHRLQIQPYQQTHAFLKGLSDVINPAWISLFNQSELQILLSGDSSEIDVEDLRRHTSYGGVYQIGDDGEEHETIKLFWKVMKSLDDSDRRRVLKFVTSSPRAPLLGFSELNPSFSIRDSGGDGTRLPSTSTCVNLLKLPRYSSEDVLREKLLYAINSGAGFDLS